MKTNPLSVALIGAALLFGTVESQAAALITSGTQWTDPSGSLAPGTEGYFIGTSFTTLSSFSVTLKTGGNTNMIPASTAQTWGGGAWVSSVIPPGETTAIKTGLLYNDAGRSFMDMLTFQLTNAAVTSFSVWLLDSTMTAANNHNTAISLSVNGGAKVTQTTTATSHGLEWTQFTVSGASVSDVFTVTVSGTSGWPSQNLEGITFDAVPEPATWAMMAGGVGLLAFARRLRRLA